MLNTKEIPVPFVEKQVVTEQDVTREVRNQIEAGVDYIKLYVGLTPELVKAATHEAHSNEKKSSDICILQVGPMQPILVLEIIRRQSITLIFLLTVSQ